MRLKRKKATDTIASAVAQSFNENEKQLISKIHFVEHHKAHLASAFLVSPFRESAVISIDGFGDFASCMLAKGTGNKIETLQTTFFPHSIGLFYTAITQLLGFTKYGDEFKVMGLAPYGKPTYVDKLQDVISYTGNGTFNLDLSYFIHHTEGVDLTWKSGAPTMGNVYSQKMADTFGARHFGQPLTEYHKNLAASLQKHTENIIFSLINHLHEITGCDKVCLAGGVAMNSVANGKVFDNTPFKDVFVQPAAGDAGTSLGAAYYLYNCIMNKPRSFVMETSLWGPQFTESQIAETINRYKDRLNGCRIEKITDQGLLCKTTAEHIAQGKVTGWFQGKLEWGARALGNRSILADPTNPDMKDILNARIKKREAFRPFAPSILEEAVADYFEIDYPDPFMTKVYPIKKDKRASLPAVTHVDGSGRLQTVSKKTNPLFWNLINQFGKISGIPIVLNTSFNENEPIVCRPEEALDCFLRTKMDILVLGNFIIERI